MDQNVYKRLLLTFIKTFVNPYRILEFVFINTSLDKLLRSLFHRLSN